MSMSDLFDETKIYVIDLSNDGRLTRQPEEKWASSLNEVSWTCLPSASSRLVIVQGINDKIKRELQDLDLGVGEGFFANHSDHQRWYLTDEAVRKAPQSGEPWRAPSLATTLPSQVAKLNFVKLRFINARKFRPSSSLPERVSIAYSDKLCPPSCLGPSWSQRTALVVRQISPANQGVKDEDALVMFAHTSVSAWFKMRPDVKGWTGIILLDPPFIPRHESGPPFEVKSPEDLQSLCEQYYDFLHKMPSDFLAGAALQPFLIIRNLYQIIASDWVVMGSYINRELQAIEFNLEIAQHDVAQCEEYLVHLAAYRRRISCYLDLVRQQLASIEAFGCKAWAVGRLRNEMEQARNELREDFKHVLGLLENHSQRINHNLELLLGLRGVYESRESRILSRNMASLALVGILFLPFNTVATILGMQGDFGPGSKRFWVYWAISIPVMTVLVLVHIAYSIPREPSVRRT